MQDDMDSYVTGVMIKNLREEKRMTQKELADKILVSEKTISKWETGKGLPDISLLEPLSKALGVSLVELFQGEVVVNKNKAANILKTKFYICPVCGNIITSIGEGSFSCCGRTLIVQEAEKDDSIQIEKQENELYIVIASPMNKTDYIFFIAYCTIDSIQMKKLYPEQNAEAIFSINGPGIIYYYNNKNGLFSKKV